MDLPSLEFRPSRRRKRTVSAHWDGDVVVVLVPDSMPEKERLRWGRTLAERLMVQRSRTSAASDAALLARCALLSDRYLEGRAVPSSARWVENQTRRWGSCTPSSGAIRVSDRLRSVPPVGPGHGPRPRARPPARPRPLPAFYALLAGVDRLGEADAYLEGYSLGLSRRA